ncbi:MAG: tRNA 2-thiocytidine(32) synthetase TtcA, partial [Gammaproteobacteria bacterium]|nr:tRNA 2-thiocytidine(32) synthetase TtcA [Gammaproteobacteria bacterium]
DDQRNIVIRPMAYVRETAIKAYADLRQFPVIPCNLCGSQPNLQRQAIKAMLKEWDISHPGRVQNIFNAMTRVTASHLLDKKLFDFANLNLDDSAGLEELDMAIDAGSMSVGTGQ